MTQPLSTTTPLTLGQQVTLTPPASSLNIGAVVIANHSSYVVSVVVNASIFNLSPYSKDRFDMGAGSSPVQINTSNPEGAPNTLPAYLISEWYSVREEPAPASYPVALTASPYAIAAQVAAQQLAQGVPNVLQTVRLPGAPFALGVAGGGQDSTGQIDVSGYASLLVRATAGGPFPAGVALTWTQYDTAGNPIDADAFGSVSGSATPNITAAARIAVVGPTIQFVNTNAAKPVGVDVYGSNRPALARFDRRSNGSQVAVVTGVTAAAAGDTALAPGGGAGTAPSLQGLCYAFFALGSSTATGYFQTTDAAGNTMILCDAQEMATGGASGTKYTTKLLALPPDGANHVVFHQTSTVSISASARFVAANQ